MNANQLVSTILVNLVLVISTLGQSLPEQPEENWLRDLGLYNAPYVYHLYDRYSLEDINRFKEQVAKVRTSAGKDDWEGTYHFNFPDSVTFSQLTWNTSGGYFSLSVYTCLPELRSLRYGRVEATSDSVAFVSEKSIDDLRFEDKYIKVRWGHRRYLVNEKSLLAFTEKAAGRYVEPENADDKTYQLWSDYWVTSNDENDSEPKGVPVLPARYKHLERKPLITRISAVGIREVKEDVETRNTIYSGPMAVYKITVQSGASTGFAPGMTLINLKTGEEIFLQTVSKTSATGILIRSIDDNGKDHCLNDNGEKIRCPVMSSRSNLSTKSGSFWW